MLFLIRLLCRVNIISIKIVSGILKVQLNVVISQAVYQIYMEGESSKISPDKLKIKSCRDLLYNIVLRVTCHPFAIFYELEASHKPHILKESLHGHDTPGGKNQGYHKVCLPQVFPF